MNEPSFKKSKEQAQLLQQCLVVTIDVALTLKHLHWNIRGPKFQPIHELLDVVVDHAHTASDDLAERMVAMGVAAIGQRSSLPGSPPCQAPDSFIEDRKVIEIACDTLIATIAVMRSAQEQLGKIDAVTEDLVIGLITPFEKQLWMLRSHLL